MRTFENYPGGKTAAIAESIDDPSDNDERDHYARIFGQEHQRRKAAEALLAETEVVMRAHSPLSSLPERINKHFKEWDG